MYETVEHVLVSSNAAIVLIFLAFIAVIAVILAKKGILNISGRTTEQNYITAVLAALYPSS